MLKLLLCVVVACGLAVTLLQLRQQRLEMQFQCNRLHNQIQRQQAKLWSQHLQIAVLTAPNAISQTVSTHELNLVPVRPLPPVAGATD